MRAIILAATFREMKLTLQQKEQFFHELEQSVRSGRTLAQSLARMAGGRGGSLRRVAEQMVASGGPSIAEYLAAAPHAFGPLDRDVAGGGEAAGRLDAACGYLRAYYGSVARAKRRALAQLAYPIFLLHFGALVLSAPAAVTGGTPAFVTQLVALLGGFYALFAVIGVGIWAVVRLSARFAGMDRIFRATPVVGGALVAVTGTRFCAVAAMLVRSGAGVLGALERAGTACGSARLRAASAEVARRVRDGAGLAEAALSSGAFPEPVERALDLGEQTGRLDDELLRAAEAYREATDARLDALAAWIPRLIYLAVVGALVWIVVRYALGYIGQIQGLIDGL